MTEFILACTGHRPPRLGLDYTPSSNRLLTRFAVEHLTRMVKVTSLFSFSEVVSGVAQGWNQAVAHAAVILGIPRRTAGEGQGGPHRLLRRLQDGWKPLLLTA